MRSKLLVRLGLVLALSPSIALAESLRPVTGARTDALDPGRETWIPVMVHAHSIEGSWTYGPGGEARADRPIENGSEIPRWLEKGKKAGLEAMVFTEHNTIAHFARFRDQDWDAGSQALLLFGVEFSGGAGNGHLGLVYTPRSADDCIRPARTDRIDVEEYRRAIEAVHDRGGLAIANHPASGTFPWPDESTLGADAVEVFTPAPMSISRALEWYQERLVAERRAIFPIAGADFHANPVLGPVAFKGWVNLVRVQEVSPEAILESLVAGRLVAQRHWPWQDARRMPRAFLAAGPDLSGRIGDEVPVAGRTVEIQVLVENARGFRARVFDETSKDPVAEFDVASDSEVRRYEKDLPEDWGFVRVELAKRLRFERAATGLVTFRRTK